MARPIRIEYPNAHYHVMNRSENKTGLFPSEQFYQAFLDGVKDAALRFNVEVQGWCLLKNEYHLLIKTPEGNLSRFMRQVDGLYTLYYQKLKRKRGSVFRARYKAVLFQPEHYLARLSRYIHQLPRSARQSPLSWQWSSLKYYINDAQAEFGLNTADVLGKFGIGESARQAYCEYMQKENCPEISKFYGKKNQMSVLGDKKFRDRVKAIAEFAASRESSAIEHFNNRPSATKIVNSVANTFKVSDNSILHAARGPGSKNVPRWVAMYLCQEAGGITLQKIAQKFGLQRYGTVSTTIGKLKDEFADNQPLFHRVDQIRQALNQ